MKRERPAISMNGDLYARFQARARELGRSMASIVDELSHDLRVPTPRVRAPSVPPPPNEVEVAELEPAPPRPLGIYCASCVNHEITTADGARYLDGARICRACDEDHPRSGRYAFDDGAKASESTVWRGSNLGAGNRRKGAHT